MRRVLKQLLSNSINGKQILLSGTNVSTANVIHIGVENNVDADETWIYAYNNAAVSVTCSMLWGGISSPNDITHYIIPSYNSRQLLIDGKLINNSASIKAFCNIANSVTIDGFVNRIYEDTYIYKTTATISTNGTRSVLSFTQNGTLDLSTPLYIEALVVAGGGGGFLAGAGAGGLLYTSSILVPSGKYNITVGNGGGGAKYSPTASNGYNSVFYSLTAVGGGHGGGSRDADPAGIGGDGGSGGGDGGSSAGTTGSGIVGQGFGGGLYVAGYQTAGGGGGASEVGSAGITNTGGYGGDGTQYSISGVATYYAGGGGGACVAIPHNPGLGGLGGGGTAEGNDATGVINTGGGGGGKSDHSGSSGGSGIVILSFNT